ncbi:MAG TPA: AAA family ATPase, partial [Stellaceae bacterium]|nr:AAA family ATPase [Stellaceae bacterium]
MAGQIITIAQQKGGAGKTTLAAHLALAWAGKRSVSVIDIDPQGSLAAWFRLREQQAGT